MPVPRGNSGRRSRQFRRWLDEWFATIAHYAGLALLAYAFVIDRLRNPAILPAALALIFGKWVAGNGDHGD